MPKMFQTWVKLYYGILSLVISLLGVLVFSKSNQRSYDFLFWKNKIALVKVVYLEGIKDASFQLPHIEQKNI